MRIEKRKVERRGNIGKRLSFPALKQKVARLKHKQNRETSSSYKSVRPRRRSIQIHIQHPPTLHVTLISQLGEECSCAIALPAHFDGFFAARSEFLDGLVHADAEVVGGEAQDFAD